MLIKSNMMIKFKLLDQDNNPVNATYCIIDG